jgi:hypothetical protein
LIRKLADLPHSHLQDYKKLVRDNRFQRLQTECTLFRNMNVPTLSLVTVQQPNQLPCWKIVGLLMANKYIQCDIISLCNFIYSRNVIPLRTTSATFYTCKIYCSPSSFCFPSSRVIKKMLCDNLQHE